MQLTNVEIGNVGEDLATGFLQECGFVILARNWRTRRGELDIIARDGDTLVFCEVKTRRSTKHGLPIEAVTTRKLEHMKQAAVEWLGDNRIRFSGIRFDVVSIFLGVDGTKTVTHTRGVVS
jgi:putative endonuclease